ncbi:bifunctional pyr operon transcriptional regulator/uracil phosphoribosyltransferase PyrR [Rivibacter subsaxonicus]|uniref:Pyrimidine operon attenuation protein/uracil phosphoribosyltransferase n=1 Tax=Rivibacter subsaxonicus TaxID=457575 RepID=A0A4Q7VZM4_9BURK|nr:bifunctional pyr operon transcriptional regulator/uracil phosphoribosyltransferase PyrR [Rivibacter subsaxonicus]RZU02372.1 pyrimidine operon attenuation protein/uracil phosphoribosyltransferase [Rivibacter subsaxonicus]
MSTLSLDAEALAADLARRLRALPAPEGGVVLVGIWSGGAWLAERLQRELGLPGAHGVISSTLHRDDFGSRGLASTADPTALPFDVDGRHVLLIDDVLHTGRTTRAVINELFDYGRPASVTLAVLVDRGGRELPIEAAVSAARISLPASQKLTLTRDAAGRLSFAITDNNQEGAA